MRLYKLTDSKGQTRNETQWGPNVTHSATGGPGQPLCTDGWIHAYEHPLMAVIMNPAHGKYQNPRMWVAEGEIGKRDGQLKCGCRSLTTMEETPLPAVTTEQLVHFAILVAKQVYSDPGFTIWADNWISGKDRTEAAAWAAAVDLKFSARTAAWATWAAVGAEAAANINLVEIAEQIFGK